MIVVSMAALGLLSTGSRVLEGLSFSTVVTDRDGRPLRVFLTEDDKYRIFRDIGDFPTEFLEIVLLQEDQYFRFHAGVNPVSILRAAWQSYVVRDRFIGGSTITMQLVRLRYGLYTRSPWGKTRQMLRAMALEIRQDKQDILEAYLNLVPCGGNIEGFPAAALYYFGKDITDLSPSEQFLLAVIPQDPVERSPKPGVLPQELLQAREVLMSAWLESHPEDQELLGIIRLPVAPLCRFPFATPHLAEYLLAEGTGVRRLVSSIDSDIQTLAEDILARYIDRNRLLGVDNGALLVADHRSGEILAAVGSADYASRDIQGQVNGFASKRSPGSTLKPFVYALALDQGLIVPDSMLRDAASSFSEYTPDNYAGDFQGAVPAWRALVDSRNIPAIALANRLTNPNLYDLLADAEIEGLQDFDHYGLSIVLGSAELTMIELAGLYAALANDGLHQPLRARLDVPSVGSRRLFSPEAAWLVLDMLARNTPPSSTRPEENIALPIAFKTGTSIGFKDAWCAAVAGPYVIITWVGRFDGIGDPIYLGRRTATPLLFSFAEALLSRTEYDVGFAPGPPPGGLSRVDLCSVSGHLPGEHCPYTDQGWFIPGVSPIRRCDIHREIWIDDMTGYRADGPGPGRHGEVREFWPSDMLELFAEAGLPRLVPPPYPSEGGERNPSVGQAPKILYPLSGTTYLLEEEGRRRREIPLSASADADARELFWFADARFIGRSPVGQELFWSAEPGFYRLSVLDEAGRGSSVVIQVARAPE